MIALAWVVPLEPARLTGKKISPCHKDAQACPQHFCLRCQLGSHFCSPAHTKCDAWTERFGNKTADFFFSAPLFWTACYLWPSNHMSVELLRNTLSLKRNVVTWPSVKQGQRYLRQFLRFHNGSSQAAEVMDTSPLQGLISLFPGKERDTTWYCGHPHRVSRVKIKK